MNTVDFRVALKGFRGEPVTEGTRDDMRTVTLGEIVLRALNAGPSNRVLDAREVTERFELQRQIIACERHSQLMELSSDQQTLIKACVVAAGFAPWIAGQVREMVENGTPSAPDVSAGASVVPLTSRAREPSIG